MREQSRTVTGQARPRHAVDGLLTLEGLEWRMRRPVLIPVVLSLVGSPAFADGVYKDREGIAVRPVIESSGIASCGGKLLRRTNCSPDYVGSEMGLAKPSYYGTRVPDDGLPVRRW
jgi:hypothetical protein